MDERLPIWKKDDYFPAPEGRIDMDPAVVNFDEGRVYPLVWMYDWDAKSLLGKICQVRLEDGEISGEVDWYEDRDRTALEVMFDEENPHVRLGGYYTDVQLNEDKTQVLSCDLKAVAVILLPIYPIPPISKEEVREASTEDQALGGN